MSQAVKSFNQLMLLLLSLSHGHELSKDDAASSVVITAYIVKYTLNSSLGRMSCHVECLNVLLKFVEM